MKVFFISVSVFLISGVAVVANAAGSGVIVAPSIIEGNVQAGGEWKGVFLLKSVAEETQTVELRSGFFDMDAYGKTELVAGDRAQEDGVVLRFAQSRITLAPGQTQEVSYTVSADSSAPDGVRARAIIVETECDSTQEAVSVVGVCVRARIGMPIILTVGESVLYDASVDIGGPSFVHFGRQSRITASVHNTGSGVIRPQGVAVISSLFGREIARVAIDQKRTILPGHVRTFDLDITHTRAFGLYRISVHMRDENVGTFQRVWWALLLSDLRIAWAFIVPIMGIGGWYFWYRRVAQKRR